MRIDSVGKGLPGAEVSGFDARSMGAADVDGLKLALAEHGMLFFRGQDFGPSDLVAVGRKFGELELSTREQFLHPEDPEVYIISNIVKDGKPIGNGDDGFFWHTDLYYFERPTAYTFLYAVEAPEVGADTWFCSTRHMYDELTPEERQSFEGMKVRASHSRLFAGRLTQEQIDKYPDVIHPLVRTHPVDGKKCLYFSSIRVSTVCGWSQEKSDALIGGLLERAVRPDHIYAHKWQPGDLLIWDNRGLLHTATNYDKERYRRLVYRVTVTGERPC